MIATLFGRIVQRKENSLIIETPSGVGYLVNCSSATSQAAHDDVRILVETVVRQDQIVLFGFATEEEQAWFKTITSIQGAGAGKALAILSAFTPDDLGEVLRVSDDATLADRSKGIGPKLAKRIVSELGGGEAGTASGDGRIAGAQNGLKNLGYDAREAKSLVLRAAHENPDAATAQLITLALRLSN